MSKELVTWAAELMETSEDIESVLSQISGVGSTEASLMAEALDMAVLMLVDELVDRHSGYKPETVRDIIVGNCDKVVKWVGVTRKATDAIQGGKRYPEHEEAMELLSELQGMALDVKATVTK